jgi:hypothetical protein
MKRERSRRPEDALTEPRRPALLLAGCGSPEPAAVPPVDADVRDMMLHLPDEPPGARIGDDSSCGTGISSEGGSDRFVAVALEVQSTSGGIEHCFNQLESYTP